MSLGPTGRGADAGAGGRPARKSARVDSTGRFEIRGLSVGEYLLSARFRRSSDGSLASIRRIVEIREPVREMGIILELSR